MFVENFLVYSSSEILTKIKVMRTLFLSLLCLFGALTILQAQDSSYGVAYQAVARDADGDPLADTELAVRVTLKDGATTVWQEEHASVLTNQFGNLALTIGSGVTSAGTSLADVDWSAAGLHFEIEVDAGTGTYASFGDVAVQAVPVAMYALNGQEEEIAALNSALGALEGDFNSFVTSISNQVSSNDSDISELFGLVQDNQGAISLLQTDVSANTADLASLLGSITVGADGSVTIADVFVENITVSGTLDLSQGAITAQSGSFNTMSAGDAYIEEANIETGSIENLTAYSANFTNAVTVPTPTADNQAASKGYVDAADANLQGQITSNDGDISTLQSDLGQEITDRTNADTNLQGQITSNDGDISTLQSNLGQEITDRTNADTNLQGQITSNDGDISTLQADLGQEITDRTNADTNLQGQITSNDGDISTLQSDLADEIQDRIDDVNAEETRATTAEGNLQTAINNEISARETADEALQDDVDDNTYRIANAAAASGFDASISLGIDNVPVHPGHSGTTYLDGSTNLVGSDEALDAAIANEVSRAQGAESTLQGQITTNDNDISQLNTDLQSEITRATNRENNIESEAATARGVIAANLQSEITRATGVEGSLQGQITSNDDDISTLQTNLGQEVTDRTNADTNLQGQITSNDGDISTLQSDLGQEVIDRTSAVTNVQNQINSNDTDISNLQSDLQDEIQNRINDVDAEETRATTAEGNIQSELDATQTGAGLNADGTYASPTAAQGAFYTIGSTSLRNADLNLDEAIQSEKNARQNAIGNLEDALLEDIDSLASAVAGNDSDIEALQGQVDALNLVAPGGPDWTEILETAQYFEHNGQTVSLEAPYNAIEASSILGSTATFNSTQIQVLTVDNAATVQNLTVGVDMYSPDGTIDDFDATHVEVYDDLTVGGVSTLNDDVNVAGNVDIDLTLNVDGETTLGANLSVTGTGSFGGTVTAADATAMDHLASFGQLNQAADSLQENINDERARAIARENDIQAELDATQSGAGLAADGSYNGNSGTNYIDAANSLDNADGLLDAALKNEEQRAISAEGVLQTNINNEATRAMGAEGLLNDRADSLATAVAGNDSEIAGLTTRMGDAEQDILDVDGRADSLATAVANNDTDILNIQGDVSGLTTRMGDAEQDIVDLNGRADSLATAVAGNDSEIAGLTTRMGDAEQDILDVDGRADSLATAVANNDTDIFNLQQDLATEVTNRTNADITISDSLQANINDEMTRAMTREGQLQTELDNTQAGAGLAADGSYNGNSGTSYIDAATSLDNADDILDAALKTEEQRAITREDSIIDVLYWNLGTHPYNGQTELTLDPGIDNIDLEDTDMDVDVLTANAIGAQNANLINISSDNGEFNDLQADDIQAGEIFTGDITWTNALAWGSNSVTDLQGILNVDGATTLNSTLDVDGATTLNNTLDVDGATTLNSTLDVDFETTLNNTLDVDGATTLNNTLDVDGQADFHNNVNIDGDLDVDGMTTVDGFNAAEHAEFDATMNVDGNADFQAAVDVDGATTLNNTLDVDGQADFHNNVNIDGDLDVDGMTTVDGFNASEAADFDATVNVDGATTLNNTLDVDGQADFHSNVNIDGNADVDGNMDVDGMTTVDGFNASEAADFDATVNVDGATTLNSTLGVTGAATMGSTLSVTGNTTMSADASVGGNLDVTGTGAFGGTVTAADATASNHLASFGQLTTAADTLQQNIVDEMNRAMTREGELQTELDNTQTGAGLAANGAYSANGSANYIASSTSLADADDDLDTALKAEETRAITREDSIIDVLYWNKSIYGTDSIEQQVSLDPGITRVNNLPVDYRVRSLFAANNISADQGTFDVVDADEAEIDELTTFEIFNYGRITTDELRWTDARAVGSNSTTWLEGTLDVDGVTTLNDSLDVDGNAVFHSSVWIDGALDVDGATTLNSTLDVDGVTTLNDSLDVDGNAVFHSSAWIDGALDVDGATTLNSTLDVDGASTLNSTLDVDGVTTLNDSLDVDGGADFNSTVNIDGAATLNSTLDVDGASTLNSTLDVDGQADFHDDVNVDFDLDVDGQTTLDETYVDEYFEFNGSEMVANATDLIEFDLDGDAYIGIASSDVWDAAQYIDTDDSEMIFIDGYYDLILTVDDAAGIEMSYNDDEIVFYAEDMYFEYGDVWIENDLDVDGGTTLNSTLDVDGASTLNSTLDVDGAATLNSTLDVDGVTTLNDSLDVDGNAVFHSSAWVDGALDVDGATTLNSTLDVDGVTTLNDSLDVDGGADFNSTVNVDGATTLNSTLDVDGDAAFHGNVSIDEDLDVDGYTTLDSTTINEYLAFAGTNMLVDATDSLHLSAVNDITLRANEIISFADVDYVINSGEDMVVNAGNEIILNSDDDFNVNAYGDIWMYAEESIELYSDAEGDGYHGLYIDVEDDNDPMMFLPESDSDYDVELYSDDAVSVNANYDAGLELNADINAALLYGDSVLVDGRFVSRDQSDFYSDVNIDGALDVDGATTLNSTLDVDGASTLNSTLDVDGVTTLNDSLDVDGGADFNSTVNIDGASTLNSTLDVDGATTLNSTLDVDGASTLNSTLDVDGATTLNSTLDVDGVTTLNDSLDVDGGVHMASTLEVDGATDLNSTLTVDDFAQFNDTVSVAKHLVVETPTLPAGTSAGIIDEPEFAVKNAGGDYIVQVDGHNDIMTVQNLTVTDQAYWTGNMEVTGDISGDNIISTSGMFAGNTNYGYNWPSDGTDYNMLTRRDYVDFHRINQTDVPQAWSYDADVFGSTSPDYNEAVYYMNGNVVLYSDSANTYGKNYSFTIKGRNFDQLRDQDGNVVDNDEVKVRLWAENNYVDVTGVERIDSETLEFRLGYDQINGIVACTDGVVRPTVAIGTQEGGYFMTGLHLFLDIVAPAPTDD